MPSLRMPCPNDYAAIDRLHADCFGPGRFTRTAYRIRESAEADRTCSRVMFDEDRLIASIELSKIEIGGQAGALLLGPIAVSPDDIGQAHGATLMEAAIDATRAEGHQLIVLVGDMAYFQRFGFEVSPPGDILLPGPVDPERILTLELKSGTRQQYNGLIRAES